MKTEDKSKDKGADDKDENTIATDNISEKFDH